MWASAHLEVRCDRLIRVIEVRRGAYVGVVAGRWACASGSANCSLRNWQLGVWLRWFTTEASTIWALAELKVLDPELFLLLAFARGAQDLATASYLLRQEPGGPLRHGTGLP